jgi:hypothetical protein
MCVLEMAGKVPQIDKTPNVIITSESHAQFSSACTKYSATTVILHVGAESPVRVDHHNMNVKRSYAAHFIRPFFVSWRSITIAPILWKF